MPIDKSYRLDLQHGWGVGDRSRTAFRGTGQGLIEVGEFSPPVRASLFDSRILLSVAGALVSSLLHVAVLTAAIWGGGRVVTPVHKAKLAPATGAQLAPEIAMQWVAIHESATAESSHSTAPAIPSPRLTPMSVPADYPQLAAHFPEQISDTASDSDASARLYGQYLGQIDARIDRAWIRPRTPIGDTRFTCQVRIDQDAAGNVIDVVLEHCNGSPRWQLSLVHAIESASPLPAPSDPAVFAPAVHMSFQADPPDSGLTADQYEPESVANEIRASDRAAAALEALRRLQDPTPHRELKPSVIDLRIEGSHNADSSASDSREQQTH
jgi:hypothetical protein